MRVPKDKIKFNISIKSRILVLLFFLSFLFFSTNKARASTHPGGSNVVANGTIYFLDGTSKRPYTSAGAFLSYGFNHWDNVSVATQDDLKLPTGSFVPPRDGSLINDKGTVYIITKGKRAGFTKESIFLGLGYKWSSVSLGDTSFMQSLAPIDSASQIHPADSLINANGTIFISSTAGRIGIPDPSTFYSWGYSFSEVVPANSYDQAYQKTSIVLNQRPATELSAFNYYLKLASGGGAAGSGSSLPTPAISVSITSPISNSEIGGSTFFQAQASGNLLSLQFQIDGNNVGGPLSSFPYSLYFNTAQIANGSHTLVAIATDIKGNQATSAPITINVVNGLGGGGGGGGSTSSGPTPAPSPTPTPSPTPIPTPTPPPPPPGPTITITNANLRPAFVGIPYSVLLIASGGAAPYNFSVKSGTLPTGLSLLPSGLIYGTPTQSGQFSVTFSATDSSSPTAGQTTGTYTIGSNNQSISAACIDGIYGVCGDPYEGNGAPANQTPITSCQTISTSGNYKVTQNIGSDQTAACLTIANKGVNLDLGGNTVTGAIYDHGLGGPPGSGDGNVIYDGTVTCNRNTSAVPQACIYSYVDVTTSQYRIHHIVVNQNNSNGKHIQIEEDNALNYTGNGSGLGTQFRVDHVYWDSSTINDPSNNRYGSIAFQNNMVSAEGDHIWIHCTDGSAFNDCEGMGAGGNPPGGPQAAYFHDNYIQTDYSNIGDTARAIDCDFGSGHQACDIYNNILVSTDNRAVRYRNSDSSIEYTQVGNVYDNSILNIQQFSRYGSIHIGENDFSLENAAINIFGNTFEINTGKGIYIAAATGVNVHDNVATCYLQSCANALDILHTDAFSYAPSGTSVTIKNTLLPADYTTNAVIACGIPGVQAFGCTDNPTMGTSSVTYCNTGTVAGNGTIKQDCP